MSHEYKIDPMKESVNTLHNQQSHLQVQVDNLENRVELSERRLASTEDGLETLAIFHPQLKDRVKDVEDELARMGQAREESDNYLRKHVHYLWLSLVTTWGVGILLFLTHVVQAIR